MFFNGIDLTPYLRIKDIRGRGIINRNINAITSPGMHGEHLSSIEYPSKYLEIDIRIVNEELRGAIDDLNSIFSADEPVPIIFPDEPDMTYYGTVEGSSESGEKVHLHRHDTTIFVRRSDPRKYGFEKTADFPSDAVTLKNEGTAEADPIFEFEATEPVTFAMIQNQDEQYQMIGRPAEHEEEVVSTRTLLLEERGDNLDEWDTTPVEVDGGDVSGHLSTDGEGITVPDYGSGDEWHGPALIKEVPEIQDFEVQMHLQGRTYTAEETYRIEFYLYDDSMNVLGKMAVVDSLPTVMRKDAEGRVGPFAGRFVNYPLSSRNYRRNWDFFFGMVRMRRIGKRFECYVTRIANDGARHVLNLDTSFVDSEEDFQGRLKYVQIHIGKYSESVSAYAPKINIFRVFELTEETQDQTPYIANEGDIITFDHKTDELLINGEDRTDLKDFGGEYFKLRKGENHLVVHPSDSFNASVRYRERFR
ncbi:distal tail protein Dit [Alteribacter populi]|uniref:distal tail protein Dit n=1 Tax=Alteribacter populi TaxID=2011011 RepID=UPI000BBB2262|nr:distal tail protein Dit [Alteribacter populi]